MIHHNHRPSRAQSRELRDLVVAMRRGPGAALHEYHGGVAAVSSSPVDCGEMISITRLSAPVLYAYVAGQRGNPAKRGIVRDMDDIVCAGVGILTLDESVVFMESPSSVAIGVIIQEIGMITAQRCLDHSENMNAKTRPAARAACLRVAFKCTSSDKVT